MLFQSSSLHLRTANLSDAAGIQRIYRPYILNTTYNLEVEVPSVESLEERITNTQIQYPFIVAEYENQVVGFCYLSNFYHYNIPSAGLLSIYVAEDAPIRGIGHELFTSLEFMLADTPIQTIISSIVANNIRSIRFHEKHGFTEMLRIPNLAQKEQHFLDIVWMQKSLPATIPYIQYSDSFEFDMEMDTETIMAEIF